MIVQSAYVEGCMPDGTRVASSVTTDPDIGQDARDRLIRLLTKALEHKHPGVKDVHQVGSWLVYDQPEEGEADF